MIKNQEKAKKNKHFKKSRESIYRTVKVTHLFAVIDRKEVLKCRQEAGKM